MEQTLSLILMIIKSPVTHVLMGAFLGFLASNNIENRKQKNLNTSLYQETDRISKQFKNYLPILLNQLNKPKQEIIEGTKPIYLNFLEAIIIELMATKYSLTSEQLDLVHNLRAKLYGFEKTYKNRDDEACNAMNNTGINFFRLNPNHTVQLILDCIETIYFIDLFCSQKEKFTLSQKVPFLKKYQAAFRLSEIEYDEETYVKVESHLNRLGIIF